MGEEDSNPEELYSHEGVSVKDIKPNKQGFDCHVNMGKLSIVDNSELGKCIEWYPNEIAIESHDQGWEIVQGTKSHAENSNDETRNKIKPAIRMLLKNPIQMSVSENGERLTIVKDGTEITFYFLLGNAGNFLENLKSTMHHRDLEDIQKSFAELNLFPDDHKRNRLLQNFQDSPYETVMNVFSNVTNAILYRPQSRFEDETCLSRNASTEDFNYINGKSSNDDYELVTQGPALPPRTMPPRWEPLNSEKWNSFFSEFGRIEDPHPVKEIIFHGGIVPERGLRKEVWKYLLDFYPWNSTTEERRVLKELKTQEYFIMKSQWQSMTPDQIERFNAFKERKTLVEKDVHRTDRNMDFFAGDNNPNLMLLQDILMTYVMYNFDIGYVQGMSDLLSPLLVQLEDEVDAFWCFVGFMNRMSRNFELDQERMNQQLQQLYCLLRTAEPDLSSYFHHHESKNMAFCFRWLLVWFKREFSYEDIYTLWEVLWTEFYCKNYHLLICTAIFNNEKETLMSNNYGFIEILKHINDLANTMDLECILRKAEGIYLQLSTATNIPSIVRQILGLDPVSETQEDSEDDCNYKSEDIS